MRQMLMSLGDPKRKIVSSVVAMSCALPCWTRVWGASRTFQWLVSVPLGVFVEDISSNFPHFATVK